MATPFDFINSINNKTPQLPMDEVGIKDYIPFMVNRGLSFNQQTIMFANEINLWSSTMPKEWQYDFYWHGIPKGKRYDKWIKKEESKDKDLALVQKYFRINILRAKEALRILTEDQLSVIRKMLEQGGRK
jgi:hypothetical protein